MRYEARESACPDLTTEDNRTPIKLGDRLFNYYDGKWGIVGEEAASDGWFRFDHDDGTYAILNGVRVSTVDPNA